MAERYEWSESFQRKILALYIREPQICYRYIEPVFFTSPVLSHICTVVKKQYDAAENIYSHYTETTLATTMRDVLVDKMELWPQYEAALRRIFKYDFPDKVIITDKAYQWARARKYTETLSLCEEDINAQHYAKAHERFDALRTFGRDPDIGLRYWDDMNIERWNQDIRGQIPTKYFHDLDKRMHGGIGAGELGIVLGPGKRGKSTLLGIFAAGAMLQHKRIAIASGEITAEAYRRRLDSMLLAIEHWRLNATHENRNEKYLKERVKILSQLKSTYGGELYIKHFPSGKADTDDIESWLDDVGDIDLLIVDYMFLFRPRAREQERRHQIGQLAVELRGIAGERDIPVWTASQGNRASLSKAKLHAEDFAEDISQLWTLDFLLCLCQTKNEEKLRPQRGRLFLANARNTPSGFEQPLIMKREMFTFIPKQVKEGQQGRRRA